MSSKAGVFFLSVVALVQVGWCQVTATVTIDPSNQTALNPGFSGFNTADLRYAPSYKDTNYQQIAALTSPGWLRFPAGTADDIYDWQSGTVPAAWVAQFSNSIYKSFFAEVVPIVAGKGGVKISDFVGMLSNMGTPGIILVVNGFTDTPESAGLLARYVSDNHIPVLAWELSNEPYLAPGFFPNATRYADAMKPYYDAITAVIPNAVVALFYSDAGSPNQAWNAAMAAYPDRYWNAVTYHLYPSAPSSGSFAQLMSVGNSALQNATSYVTNTLIPGNNTGAVFMVTEFSEWATFQPNPVLYGGIFSAEYLMRMSALPQVKYVGMDKLLGDWGIQMGNDNQTIVTLAYNAGQVVNTSALNFGFYPSAQILGPAVANGVLKFATKLDKTTTSGGSSVAAGSGTIPALYAQAYEDAAGRQYLLVTNKGPDTEQVQIGVGGGKPGGPFPMTFISGKDPQALNSASAPYNVLIQTQTASNPATIPPYSVVRLDLTSPGIASLTPVSAASGKALVAPDSIATVYGSGLAPGAQGALQTPLPLSLQNTQVQIQDSAGALHVAPLFYVAPGQVNFAIPPGTPFGNARFTVIQGAAALATGTVQVQNVAPAIFTANSSGGGVPAAQAVQVNPSNNQQQPVNVFQCSGTCLPVPIDVSGNPVYLLLYVTGVRNRSSLGAVTCTLNGVNLPVQFAGPQGQFVGLDQINVQLPAALQGAGLSNLVLTVDGQVANTVQLSIR